MAKEYKRIVKLTEEQLREAYGDSFEYLSDNDVKPYAGQSEITVQGMVDDEDMGEPITSDEISDKLVPQWRGSYRWRCRSMRESNDSDEDGVDDFYNHEQLDVLSNGDNDDNITRVPDSVIKKADILIDMMKSSNLTSKQNAMVLNKIVEAIGMDGIPYSWMKELMYKVRSASNRH